MKILILYANRAEKSILDPVVKEFQKRKLKYEYVDLSSLISEIDLDKNLSKIYDIVYKYATDNDIKFAIVIGDRREIVFATMALFIKHIPVYQMASGDLSGKICLVDDYFRHVVTILSAKQICFSERSLNLTNSLLNTTNLSPNSLYAPNPTLNDVDIESLIRPISNDYDLILMHPQSLSRKATLKDSRQLLSCVNFTKMNIVICGNHDENYDIYSDLWLQLSNNNNFIIYDNLPKQKFLSFLKNADKFITNSSCSYYEAPIFLDESKIVRIGARNKEREIVNYNLQEIKSAKKIVDFMLKNDYN